MGSIFSLGGASIICGDFNAHHIPGVVGETTNRCNIIRNLIDSTDTQIAAQTTPTRFGHNSASITDFALTRNIHWLSQVESIAELSSDHNPLIISFDTNRRFASSEANRATDWAAFGELLNPAHYTFHPITARTGKTDPPAHDRTEQSQKSLAVHARSERQESVEQHSEQNTGRSKPSKTRPGRTNLELSTDDGFLWEMSKELRKKKSSVYALNGQGGIAHTGLLTKLRSFFAVRVNDTHSTANKGGSAAGRTPFPTLFNIYINDIPKHDKRQSLPLRRRYCDPHTERKQKLHHPLSPQTPRRARGLVQKMENFHKS
ncbi:hypothetical protein TNCV_1306511 [Trichonephila clavipes]|nr:hypothetical protein TNCV_1306511 [Trichonephila clavipes]